MASEYHRGEMDISEQVATFNLFNGLTKWGSLGLAALHQRRAGHVAISMILS